MPIGHAVAISVEVIIPRPKLGHDLDWLHCIGIHLKTIQPQSVESGGIWITHIKAILDAAQSANVIANDSQVVEISATKHAGNNPGIHVTICIVDPE